MLTIDISQIIAARGIERPYTYLVKSGLSRNIASAVVNGSIRNIKLDLIEKICLALYCSPNDILWWRPGNNTIIPSNHPMYVLKKQRKTYNWKESLKTMHLNE